MHSIAVPLDRLQELSKQVTAAHEYVEQLVQKLKSEMSSSLGTLASHPQLQQSQQQLDAQGRRLVEMLATARQSLQTTASRTTEADELAAQAAAALGAEFQRLRNTLHQFPTVARIHGLKQAVKGPVRQMTQMVTSAPVPTAVIPGMVPTAVPGAVPVTPGVVPGMVPGAAGYPVLSPTPGAPGAGAPGVPTRTLDGAMSDPANAAANAQIVAMIARQLGVDPVTAVASMLVESGGNAHAAGDHDETGAPTSFGLFQLHRGGELGNMSPEQAFVPTTNAMTALHEFARLKDRYTDPGQLAAAAQRPADPAHYAQLVNAQLPHARALLGM